MVNEKAYLNVFPIMKYPNTVNRLEILSPLRYDELNAIIGHISNLQYYNHENILYFIGDAKSLKASLDEVNVEYNEIDPLNVDIERDFHIMRVLIYKALRRFLTRIGFMWDPRRKNVVFLIRPETGLAKEINKKFKVEFIHDLTGVHKGQFKTITVYEGFRYKLDLVNGDPILTIFPRVTPLIKANSASLSPGTGVVCLCNVKCDFKQICRKLPRKKLIVDNFTELSKESLLCPEGYKKLVKIVDKSKKSYEVPSHTIHIEAHPAIMRRLGVYKLFRNLSLKRTHERTKVMQALLHYLSKGEEAIKIKMGEDIEALVIKAVPIEVKVEEDEDVWEKYRETEG